MPEDEPRILDLQPGQWLSLRLRAGAVLHLQHGTLHLGLLRRPLGDAPEHAGFALQRGMVWVAPEALHLQLQAESRACLLLRPGPVPPGWRALLRGVCANLVGLAALGLPRKRRYPV